MTDKKKQKKEDHSWFHPTPSLPESIMEKKYSKFDQIMIPKHGERGPYLEPTDHIITPRGIVYKKVKHW